MSSHRKSSTLSINASRNKPLPPIILDGNANNYSAHTQILSTSASTPSLSLSSSPSIKPITLAQHSGSSMIGTETSHTPSQSPPSSIFQPKTLKRRNLKKLTLTEYDSSSTASSQGKLGHSLNNQSSSSLQSPGTNPLRTPLRTPLSTTSSRNEDLELAENFERLAMSLNKAFHLRQSDLLFLKSLGEGQSGTVSQVLHVPMNRIMARKQIMFEKNIKVQNQILRELKILNEVKSPYIIEFYGAIFIDSAQNIGEDQDTLEENHKSNDLAVEPEAPSIHSNGVLIFMEYMDCLSLDHIMKKLGFLKEVYLSKITHNILQGLNYLYTKHKILHRDIKPSNVLLNSKGEVKICDFGVSRELSNNSIADTFVGTSTYMSPERIQGDVYNIKGDVWSVGLMLIELSTGEFPFGKKDTPNGILDLLQRIVNEEPPSLPRTKFSKELCDFVDMCLKKQDDRPTPTELLQMPKSFLKKYDKEETAPLLRHLAKKVLPRTRK